MKTLKFAQVLQNQLIYLKTEVKGTVFKTVQVITIHVVLLFDIKLNVGVFVGETCQWQLIITIHFGAKRDNVLCELYISACWG